MEVWKDIIGYEGLYRVSNLGSVKSLRREIIRGQGGVYLIDEKILKQYKAHVGYMAVKLSKIGISKNFSVHQLVAIAFLNHEPCGYKLVVNHIDLNKLNNRVDNLEVITNRENANKKHISSKSEYVGVSFNKPMNKWRACIQINGRSKHLGYFEKEIDASSAYQEKLKSLHLLNE